MHSEMQIGRRQFLRLAAAAGLGYPARRGGFATGWIKPVRVKAWRPGAAKLVDRQLRFFGEPFLVRGVVYQPTPIGQDPSVNSGTFTAYSDPRIRQRDFPRLRALGANLLRIYQPREILPEFFRDCGEAGFLVMLGFEVDTRLDFTADWARQRTVEDFRQFIRTWKGQPSVLLWAIGNGVNGELRRSGREGQLKAWHSLADLLAKAAHEEEGGQGRPVVLVSQDAGDVGVPALGSDDAAMPNVDIWGVNAYRGTSFSSLFDDLKTGKPVLITEYGLDVKREGASAQQNQIPRAHAVINLTNEIGSRPDQVVGGCLFEYSDEWWRAAKGRPEWHDWGGAVDSNSPDGADNLEWYGLYGVAPGTSGVDLLQERAVVHYLSNAWAPILTIGQPAVWFDVPLGQDQVSGRQRVSGRYSGLQKGWEIFVTVSVAGSQKLYIQPESSPVRGHSGSWVSTLRVGTGRPLPNLELELSTLVAQTPAAAAALRESARTGAPLPEGGFLGRMTAVHVVCR